MVYPYKSTVSQNYEPNLPQDVKSLVKQAWDIRRDHFPMEITAVSPTKTGAVSVTGKTCALDCSHCGKHYLKGMLTLEEAVSSGSTCSSYLISGGYTEQGKVPLTSHLDTLQELRKTARLNLHTGLVNRQEAQVIASIADVVSFDFPCSSDIINNVYGLGKNVSDYIESYRTLLEYVGVQRVVPHITVGLAEGKLSTEVKAVELLGGLGMSRLVVLVFVPTRGTRFETLPPPPLTEVATAFALIRKTIPEVPIYLGCMRPGGLYRRHLDHLAIRCGFNKIVQPTLDAKFEASNSGLTINSAEECCAL